MSFAFDFANEELDESSDALGPHGPSTSAQLGSVSQAAKSDKAKGKAKCLEIPLEELLEYFPPRLSFSSLSVPLRKSSAFAHGPSQAPENGPSDPSAVKEDWVILRRRDLFDARFQLLTAHIDADNDEDETEAFGSERFGSSDSRHVEAIDANTDLTPGVYEGGLKTWECSMDLISVLHDRFGNGEGAKHHLHGASILDIGCGTALPSAFLLSLLLNEKSARSSELEKGKTELFLLDYNLQVLQLVTVPNLVLAWYFSDAAALIREKYPIAPSKAKKSNDDESTTSSTASNWTANGEEAAEVPIHPDLLSAFLQALNSRGITLRFFAGDWAGLQAARWATMPDASNMPTAMMATAVPSSLAPYDLILTSETIYSLDSLPSLVQLLSECSRRSSPLASSASAQRVSRYLESTYLSERAARIEQQPRHPSSTLCLVAAKVLYFGVGGGVQALKQAVISHQRASDPGEIHKSGEVDATGWVEEIDRVQQGVGRVVLSVGWA